MARKDTEKALLVRGVAPELVAKLLDGFNTIQSIKDAGVDGIKEKGFSDEDAADIHSKVAGSTKRSTTRVKKVTDAVKAEDVNVVPMTLITNKHHVASDLENNLISIRDEMGSGLPLKVIVDIASRIEGTEYAEDEETQRKLVEVADRMFREHKMASHESAGVMAAHSIGEPGTQMNMRTFHYAGVANINVTQGLPRLIEIVDARRVPSTPSMDIPLIGIAAEDENVARHVASNIEMTLLLDIASVETDITNMRLIINPDVRKMESRGIKSEDIVERLNKVKAVRGMVTMSGFDIVVTSDEPSYKKLQVMYDAIKGAKIKGIDGISRAVLSKTEGSWKIITEGSNLKEVLKVEGVDADNVMTNSILEVADVLGIEAARNSIIHEAMGTLGEAGLDVDIRHIMLVADLMTTDGYVKAIGRHGVSGKKSSVLARAAFEITAAHLLHAAMVGEVDHLEGVTENIIVGQPVTLGTGAVNLIYTPKKGDKE